MECRPRRLISGPGWVPESQGEIMSKYASTLYIGTVDFAEPTLLIVGDDQSILHLASYIYSRKIINLSEDPSWVKMMNTNLHLVPTDLSGDIKRLGDSFYLTISDEDAKNFSEQLWNLAASKHPAHTYLDTKADSAGVEVVVSKGEYDPATIFLP